MRPKSLPKSLLVTALCGIVLAGFGARSVAASDDAETRFLVMTDLFWQSCAPDIDGNADLAAPAVGGTGQVDPVPVDPYDPVPLGATEQCVAERHARRVSNAFQGTDLTGYEAMQEKLTSLRYPAARIHRMPDHLGEPRARLDLRVGSDHIALQVTGTSFGVMVEVFGASEGVSVTDVLLQPQLDEPTS
ncbi:hypothetical protein ACWD26_33595 [Streptomyces sp. NPDC002787]